MTSSVQQSETADDAAQAPCSPSPLAWLLLLPIRVYRKLLSPLLPPSCRFYPSCSQYAVDALTRHGAVKGLYLAVKRLLKCAPWHPGGIDEVPDPFRWRTPRPDSSTQE